MKDRLRKRIEELQGKQAQDSKMLEQLNKEVLMIAGALQEAANQYNELMKEEAESIKKSADEAAKEPVNNDVSVNDPECCPANCS